MRKHLNPFVQQPSKLLDEDCAISFGHNTKIKKVLMQFSGGVDKLILSPDAARDVANKLAHFADLAEGKKSTDGSMNFR